MPVVSFMPYLPDVGVDKTYGDFRIWNWWKHREEVVTDPTSKRAVGWWKRPAGRSARTGVAGGGPTPCVSPRITVSPSRGTWCMVDTLELRPLPGVVLKHFTARAVICRWDVIEVHRRATASAATRFLDTLQQRMPFPLRALQVNGGSEPACGRQVRRRLRRGLPTAGVETVRAAAPLAQTQRLRRAGPAHPSGGVL